MSRIATMTGPYLLMYTYIQIKNRLIRQVPNTPEDLHWLELSYVFKITDIARQDKQITKLLRWIFNHPNKEIRDEQPHIHWLENQNTQNKCWWNLYDTKLSTNTNKDNYPYELN